MIVSLVRLGLPMVPRVPPMVPLVVENIQSSGYNDTNGYQWLISQWYHLGEPERSHDMDGKVQPSQMG